MSARANSAHSKKAILKDPKVNFGLVMAFVLFCFLAFTLPLAFERVAGGRSAERQGYTAGIIRMYCLDPTHSIVKGPQIHFGNNPFNLELTVFEWMQGVAARAVGGPACDAHVEIVGKAVSIVWSAIGILGLALLAAHLWGPLSAAMAAILLGTDELWLRYSTYTMIENRVLALGIFAIVFSLKRRAWLAALCWALTFSQKPQAFLFCAVFWIVAELLFGPPLKKSLASKKFRAVVGGLIVAAVFSVGWLAWSSWLDQRSDLPWIIHTGPRATKWYFGTWEERLSLAYLKSLFMVAFHDGALKFALPLALFLPATAGRSRYVLSALKRVAPFLAAFAVYSFIFHHVFVVHEYYALPLNVGRALTTAAMLALVIEAGLRGARLGPRYSKRLALGVMLLATIVVARSLVVGLRDYSRFALNINNPESPVYQTEWNRQVFPKPNSFVVMAPPGTGRDLLHLYLTKQRGFVWCSQNEKFAPRAYWKAQGVEFVAWAGEPNPKTRHYDWTVRSIDEELKLARANGWSSDINDVWAARPMHEWARIASRTGKDPCIDPKDFDPRTW